MHLHYNITYIHINVLPKNAEPHAYSAIGVERVKVTGEPDSFAHTVSGSLPSCSVVKPSVLVGATGKVTGMGSLQVLPLADTVTPVICLLAMAYESE